MMFALTISRSQKQLKLNHITGREIGSCRTSAGGMRRALCEVGGQSAWIHAPQGRTVTVCCYPVQHGANLKLILLRNAM